MHAYIIGKTGHGKSFFAKHLMQKLIKKDFNVYAFDPTGTLIPDKQEYPCFTCDNVNDFYNGFYKNCKNGYLFLDECYLLDVLPHKTEYVSIATQGRHKGLKVYFIAQRSFDLVNKTVRNQCNEAFIFATSYDDCKNLAKEWDSQKIMNARSFDVGQYYHVKSINNNDNISIQKLIV